MRPVWLQTSPDPVLAMLHEPTGSERAGIAALICPPFGWEEMCSHRALRAWADGLAEAGFAAARIDFPGTGDSGGDAQTSDLVDHWTQAVSDAAGWLRASTGADRVVAIGVGLGGMIAARAAGLGGPIDDLILWAVPGRGRNMVRELRAQAGIIAALYPQDAETPPPAGGSDIAGYLLAPETEAAITAIDLTELTLPDAGHRQVLLLGRDKLGVDRRLREHLEGSGATISVLEVDDFDGLMSHPQETRIPRTTIDGSITWLKRVPESPRTAPPAAPVAGTASAELVRDGRRLIERALTFPTSSGHTYGVLTMAADGERALIGAVLLNAGALRRTGPSRMWVEVARRWAARGVSTLRVDIEGIGDADGDAERLAQTGNLYSRGMTGHVQSILDQLPGQQFPESFALVGLCSGAYWALHCALQDSRVRAAMMVNLYAFYWSEELVAERDRRKTVEVLRGDVLKRIAARRLSVRQLRRAWRGFRSGGGDSIEAGLAAQVTRDLDRLRDRGTQASLMLSEGEPLYEQFKREGRLAHAHRWPNLTIDRIPSSDHMCRAIWVQTYVHERLDAALDRMLREQSRSVAAGERSAVVAPEVVSS